MPIFKVFRYVRLLPFDIQTEQGRHDERYRLAALSMLSNIVSRATFVAMTLLSVSLTLPYLGLERFGIWMTITSFAAAITFLDLGVGNALTNHVSIRAAKDDLALLCKTISGGLGFLALIGLIVGSILLLISAYFPWNRIFKINDITLINEARLATMCFAIFFGLNIFTNGIQRVFAGLQQSYQANIVLALTSLCGCIALWWATSNHQGITTLLGITLGSQSIAGLLLLFLLYARKQFTLKGISHFIANEFSHLLNTGGLFFILQIGTMVGWSADSIIISSTLGVAYVAVFSVVQRLFQFGTQPFSILNTPLWGAYADAHARKDNIFIRKTLIRSMTTTFFGVCLSVIILLISHRWLIERWTENTIKAPFEFVGLFAIWSILESCGNAFAMFLNGTGVIKIQVWVTVFFIFLVLPLKFILVENYGLSGIPFASLVAYLIAVVGVYSIWYRKEILRELKLVYKIKELA